MKKTYYDILGIDKQATLEEIKRAWRKKALELHPDKNLSTSDEFRVLFQEARQAYIVLSNASERARYDSLKHKPHAQGDWEEVVCWSRTTLRVEDLDPYLNISSEKFYTVYGKLFERIELEEIDSARLDSESLFSDDCDPETSLLFQRTSFGNENTEYIPSVEQFYHKFLNFTSIKSFSWRDQHCSAPQYRQYRRSVLNSNHKARLAYRAKYSDLVRKIAVNLMSRDPRYLKYFQEKEVKNEESRKLHDERERQERYKDIPEYKEAEWTKVDYSKICEGLADLSIEKDLEELYCPICEKRYKSIKSYENHEKGKKHIQELKKVKRYMGIGDM